MRERTDFIALIRQDASHVMAKLAVGPDHRDLHATPGDRLTEMEIVIDSLSMKVRLPVRHIGSCLNQASVATLPALPRCGLCRKQSRRRAAIEYQSLGHSTGWSTRLCCCRSRC